VANVFLTATLKGFEKVEQGLKKTSAGLKRIGLSADNVSKKLKSAGASMTSFGKKMTLGVTTPLLGIGVASVKMASTFEDSLSKITGLVGVASDQVQEWRKDILDLAPAVGKGPKELADAMFFVTSAGLRGQDALDALKASAQAAAAGLGATENVADAVTSAINAYGSETLSAADATGILVAAVREGKASAESLAPVLGRVLPVASEMGVEFDEVAAAIAAMTRVGFSADEAATSLRATMTSLLAPTSDAEKAFAEYGLSSEGLLKTLRDDGLLAVLKILKDTVGDNQAEMARIVPNVRALSGVLSLVGKNADAAEGVFKSLAKSGREDLARAFEDAAGTSAFKFQQALSSLKVTMIDLGAVLLPIAVDIAQAIGGIAERFGEMDDKTKRLVIVVAGLAAAIGPVAIVIGTLAAGIGTLLPILVSVVPVLAAITAGIVAGALAAQGLQGTFEGVKQVLTDFAKKQGPQVSVALNEMTIGWLKFKRIIAGATGNTEGVKRLTTAIDDLAQRNFELEKMADQAEESGGTVADSFFEGFEAGQEKIKQGFRDVADIAKTELGNIANAAVDFVLPAAPAAAGGGDSAPIIDVGDAAASVQEVTKEVTKLQEVIEEIRPAATSAFEDIQEGMREWAEESAITLETWGQLAMDTFDQFKQGVGDAIAEAIIEGENLAASMENVLKNVAKSVISTLVQIAIQQLVNLAVSLLTSTAQASTQGATSIALAGSNAYASTAAIPIIGPALAPAAATAAIAGATAAFQAGAAAGKAQGATVGAAAGGMENVPDTGTFLLHRGEAVLQREQNRDLRDFLARGGVTGDSVNITFAGPVSFADAIQKKKTIKDLERGLMRAQRRRAR
jgi:TP901 family phage tail tape measure protein